MSVLVEGLLSGEAPSSSGLRALFVPSSHLSHPQPPLSRRSSLTAGPSALFPASPGPSALHGAQQPSPACPRAPQGGGQEGRGVPFCSPPSAQPSALSTSPEGGGCQFLSPHNQDPHLQIKASEGEGAPEKLLAADNSLCWRPSPRAEGRERLNSAA